MFCIRDNSPHTGRQSHDSIMNNAPGAALPGSLPGGSAPAGSRYLDLCRVLGVELECLVPLDLTPRLQHVLQLFVVASQLK